MPILGPADGLGGRPQRVLVAGSSGAGKTTLARWVAAALDLPCTEIDSLFHGPNWTVRPEFEQDVLAFVARPGWVIEWQYAPVRPALADRADLLIWLDLPRIVVMRQIIDRTLRRRLRREVLWNGNVEPPLHTILTDPEHIVRWAWTTHPEVRPRVGALVATRPDLRVVRLRSRREIRAWLEGPLAEA